MKTLTIPTSYDVWLTGLKLHLDRYRGSKAELARYLAHLHSISVESAGVKVSRILSEARKPEVDVFFDIAAWLQRRQDALHDPPVLIPLADPPTQDIPRRKDATYRTLTKLIQAAKIPSLRGR